LYYYSNCFSCCRANTHKFIVIDFEFTVLEKNKHVLICGAISNSLDRFKVIKLEGHPLLLTDSLVRPITDKEQTWAIKNIIKFFGWPSAKAAICLAQIYDRINSEINNLHKDTIFNYVQRDDQKTIIVLWNGDTDTLILNRLNLNYPILNIRAYDVDNDKQFALQLMYNKRVITTITLGWAEKNGRMLNLLETHEMCCHKEHNITHAHDPCTDVILTKCLFDKLLRKITYRNLINELQ